MRSGGLSRSDWYDDAASVPDAAECDLCASVGGAFNVVSRGLKPSDRLKRRLKEVCHLNTWTRIRTSSLAPTPSAAEGREIDARVLGLVHHTAQPARDELRDRTDVVDREQHLSLDPTRERSCSSLALW